MTKIGYARVSTDEQTLSLQLDALEAVGCHSVFTDRGVSGGVPPRDRAGFVAALDHLEPGATFVVWKMDRLGRSLGGIIDTIDGFKALDVEFVSLTESIDTSLATGRAFWQIIGVMAELECNLISERTAAGMAAARRRGKKLGRLKVLNAEQIAEARKKMERGVTLACLARSYRVNARTLSRALQAGGQ